MTISHYVSGDLTADRRASFAETLWAAGDRDAAQEAMRAALEAAPSWALGWYRLGEMCEASGLAEAAAEAWRTALDLDPADRAGAALKLELIGVLPASSAPPSPFVEALFDQYAPRFEASLVGRLSYRVPQLIETMLQAQGLRFERGLDLGCGTGLVGERMRPFCTVLEGFDISAQMLRRAKSKGIYDRLEKADLQTLAFEPASADLIAAADVFLYIGALEDVVARVASALLPDGLFAFSVEHHPGPEDYRLRESRRYAHSEAYIRRLLAEAGLQLLELQRAAIRKDGMDTVEGLVVLARQPSA